MKISQEVREAAQKGMAEKSAEFLATGAHIYKVTEGNAPAEAAD
jgi:hypothetical protein